MEFVLCAAADTFIRADEELLMRPLCVSRNQQEKVLVEASINSVRFSVKIKQSDEIEEILVKKFNRFLTQRAENFFIMRRKVLLEWNG